MNKLIKILTTITAAVAYVACGSPALSFTPSADAQTPPDPSSCTCTGSVGPMGDPGAQGQQGPQGVQGPAGTSAVCAADTGSCPAGVPGATGAQGPTGPQGPAGANGTNGTNGSPGAVGAAGPQGPKGDTGTTGLTGAVGLQGPTGPAGPSLGITKDKLYVVTSASGIGGCKDENDVLLTYSCGPDNLGASLNPFQTSTAPGEIAGVQCAPYSGNGAPPLLTIVCLTVQ